MAVQDSVIELIQDNCEPLMEDASPAEIMDFVDNL
jgi:hypothetical protein